MPSILIVDDEANIRSSARRARCRAKATRSTMRRASAGARTLLREAYDIVLLDVWFPGENGLDLLAEIRDSAPATTVIMMSGHANIETAVQATRLGAYDFLEKPLSLGPPARAAAQRFDHAGACVREPAPARAVGHTARRQLAGHAQAARARSRWRVRRPRAC